MPTNPCETGRPSRSAATVMWLRSSTGAGRGRDRLPSNDEIKPLTTARALKYLRRTRRSKLQLIAPRRRKLATQVAVQAAEEAVVGSRGHC